MHEEMQEIERNEQELKELQAAHSVLQEKFKLLEDNYDNGRNESGSALQRPKGTLLNRGV